MGLSDERLLKTHLGYDIGAEHLFRRLSLLSDFSIRGNITRLLVELNRNRKNQKDVYFLKALDNHERELILSEYHDPYWKAVFNACSSSVERGDGVLHISIHTFTPVLHSVIRNCDVGILYDPLRVSEKLFAEKLKNAIISLDKGVKVRKNYPYRGNTDSVTTSLRKKHPDKYTGIEIEVNNKYFTQGNREGEEIADILYSALRSLL